MGEIFLMSSTKAHALSKNAASHPRPSGGALSRVSDARCRMHGSEARARNVGGGARGGLRAPPERKRAPAPRAKRRCGFGGDDGVQMFERRLALRELLQLR